MKRNLLLSTSLLLLPTSLYGFHAPLLVGRKRGHVSLTANPGGTVEIHPITEKEDSSSCSNSGLLPEHDHDESITTAARNPAVELPPVLKSMAEERREYQLKVGKAMDTLRTDMSSIFTKQPDFSIYDKDVTAVDPSGVQLSGLDAYKSAFAFFQTFCSFWFHTNNGMQFRMMYDFCRSSIRISWHVMLVPKVPLGGPLYIDGISYYQLDRTTGMIVEHKVEKLLINNRPVAPPYGILSLLQQDALRIRSHGVPVGVGAMVQPR